MGSAPSKQRHAPKLVLVESMKSAEKREWLSRYKNAKGPFYVLMRDESIAGDELTAAQKQKLRSLEPIGQIWIGPNRNWKMEGDPARSHTYTWPLPTGELARLADKAIWECTEFSTTVHSRSNRSNRSNRTTALPTNPTTFRADPVIVLPMGSALTIEYAMRQARPHGFTMEPSHWAKLTERILVELHKGGKWYDWYSTLTPGDQAKFATANQTALAMTSHIITVLTASRERPR